MTKQYSKIRALAIGGVPGSGKTTLMKNFRNTLKEEGWECKSNIEFAKLVSGEKWSNRFNDDEIFLIGKYDDSDSTFQGTDRLSMAVQPKFLEWLEGVTTERDSYGGELSIIYEGDRLFATSVLERMLETCDETNVVFLNVDGETLNARREARASEGENQNEKFLKGRKSKIEGIASNMHLHFNCDYFGEMNNNKQSDISLNTESLLALLDVKRSRHNV